MSYIYEQLFLEIMIKQNLIIAIILLKAHPYLYFASNIQNKYLPI